MHKKEKEKDSKHVQDKNITMSKSTDIEVSNLAGDVAYSRAAVEAAGVDPCDAAADHWRHVHNRIAASQQPRPYTIERHRAWLKRREIEG